MSRAALCTRRCFRADFRRHLTNLNIESKQVTDVIEDKNIVAVTLTGSEPAGVRSSLIAGQNLKKTVMVRSAMRYHSRYGFRTSERYGFLDVYKTTDKPIAAKKVCCTYIIYDEFLALFTKKNESGKKWANQQMKILTMVLWLEQTT
jgi:succinate-semialdehyde dehydrogenase/glutarate-semialdehyde dehydrogenase